MIYCNLKDLNSDSAVYYFGISPDNMTGEVKFFLRAEALIVKQPVNSNVPLTSINRITVKYCNEFAKGIFPDKLSFERG